MSSWADEPPAFISLARIEAMLAAWFGVKRASPQQVPAGAPAEIAARFGMDIGHRDVHEGLGGAAILDFEQLKAKARDGH